MVVNHLGTCGRPRVRLRQVGVEEVVLDRMQDVPQRDEGELPLLGAHGIGAACQGFPPTCLEPGQLLGQEAEVFLQIGGQAAWTDRELGPDQTLLFVTHEPTELPRSVSQTLRLDKGRVV